MLDAGEVPKDLESMKQARQEAPRLWLIEIGVLCSCTIYLSFYFNMLLPDFKPRRQVMLQFLSSGDGGTSSRDVPTSQQRHPRRRVPEREEKNRAFDVSLSRVSGFKSNPVKRCRFGRVVVVTNRLIRDLVMFW
jgi:hypothetical protein